MKIKQGKIALDKYEYLLDAEHPDARKYKITKDGEQVTNCIALIMYSGE